MEAHIRDDHTVDNARTDYEILQCTGDGALGIPLDDTCFVKTSLENGEIRARTFVVSAENAARASSGDIGLSTPLSCCSIPTSE